LARRTDGLARRSIGLARRGVGLATRCCTSTCPARRCQVGRWAPIPLSAGRRRNGTRSIPRGSCTVLKGQT
jgi:hypothetical protein